MDASVSQKVTGAVSGNIAGRDVIYRPVIHVHPAERQYAREEKNGAAAPPTTEELRAWCGAARAELRRARLRLIFDWPLVASVVWAACMTFLIASLLIYKDFPSHFRSAALTLLAMLVPGAYLFWRVSRMRSMHGYVIADLVLEVQAAERMLALRLAGRH